MLWIAGVAALVLVGGLMPLAIRVWNSLGRKDGEISLRKVHVGEVPRVGGFVLILGFGLVLISGLAGTTELSATQALFSISPITGVLVGALMCGLVGLLDDLVGVRARYKLLVQLAAAALAVGFGLRWFALEALLAWFGLGGSFGLGVAMIMTALFLVAGVNAINLMDGLDGLAAGICAIGYSVVVLTAILHGTAAVAVGWIAAAALGSVLGFLIHNRHPARVFMGDAGSYFLGFLLPSLLLFLYPVRDRVPIIIFSIPLMVMALPLFDMSLAILRRYVRGQPIFAGDADHIHHRMLARGVPHARVVSVLWLSTAMFSALAYLIVIGVGGWWTLGGAIVAMIVAAVLLGYHNLLRKLPAFAGGGMLGLRDRRRLVMDLLATIDGLAEAQARAGERDVDRWIRLAPDVLPILKHLGVPGFEIRRGGAVLTGAGQHENAWAWLSLPLPGTGGAELRLSLAVRLPDLQPEQLMLIERVVSLLAGADIAARHGQRDASTPAATSGVHALGDAGGSGR
ncbi:MAG: undecaprenyl/decaprenyl-phosphate alpha-N-acetylglucosaminyl 1-phosphate transferase [Myxococcales bacterium]|nr:undecaprenyl/decaprenyl-phosphate alpha-N-acetylglucosaminyl 1-phosphate transferase [Myxococcales bacterium]